MLRRPAPTIRLRLTAAYGGLFLVSGAVLLAITFLLVRHEYTGTFFINSGRHAVISFTKQGKGAKLRPGGQALKQKLAIVQNPKVAAAAAHAQSDAALHQLLIDSVIALAIMAMLSIWLGWLLAGRALRPLRTITRTAQQISASSLHRRLDLEGPDDEITQLGRTFDRLLERLEGAFNAQRQFVANASHELRTPLTLERALLELAVSDPDADVVSLKRTCEKVLAVGHQQERLIEALLTLSRSQRGLDRRDPVDIATIAAAATAAADRDGLSFTTTFQPAQTTGDPRLIERLAANLLDNAVKHNVSGGTVTVQTETRDDRAVLRVANTGDTIAAHEIERLFRPFERGGDDDRTGDDGFGLGLSIVDAIAKAHDATLTAAPGEEGGLEIEVAFPTNAA